MGIGKINIPKLIDTKLEKMSADVKKTFIEKLATKSCWDIAGRSPEIAENNYENVATTDYQNVEQLEQDVKQLPKVPFGLEEKSINSPTNAAAKASAQVDDIGVQNANLEQKQSSAENKSVQLTKESEKQAQDAAKETAAADSARATAQEEQASAQSAQKAAQDKQAEGSKKREQAKETQTKAENKRSEGNEKQTEANNIISEATSEIAAQETAIANADSAITSAQEQLTKANNMPAETEEQVQARNEAIKAAEEAVKRAEAQKAEAESKKTEAENKKADGENKAKEAEEIINEADNLSKEAETTNEEALNLENEAKTKEQEAAQNNANAEKANNEAKTSEAEANKLNQASEQTNLKATNATQEAEGFADKIETKENNADKLENTTDTKVNDAQTIANNLADDINGLGTGKNFMNNIKQINGDNVAEVLEKYQEKSGGESLIQATMDEVGLDMVTKKQAVNHIKNALAENLSDESSYEFRTTFEKELEQATSTFSAKTVGYVEAKELDKLTNEIMPEVEHKTKIRSASNDFYTQNADTINARNASADKIADKDNLNTKVFANGKINDINSKQTTGSCASHAALNNFSRSSQGQELLQNNMYVDPETGVVSIYLPEAAQKGYPKGKGDGIYTYDKQDILNNRHNSKGDGDTSAYLLAMGDYLKESENEDIGDGLSGYRPYEILTGEKAEYDIFSDNKCDYSNHSEKFREDPELQSLYWVQLKKDIKNEAAITVNFESSINTDKNLNMKYANGSKEKPFASDRHAYQVVDLTNTDVLLEESNNPGKKIKIDKNDYVKHVKSIYTYRF